MEIEYDQSQQEQFDNQKIISYFTKIGYNFRPKAFKILQNFIAENQEENPVRILESISNNIKEVNFGNIGAFSNFIDEILIEKVIKLTNNALTKNMNTKSQQSYQNESSIDQKQLQSFDDLKRYANKQILKINQNQPLQSIEEENYQSFIDTPKKLTKEKNNLLNVGLKDIYSEKIRNSLIMLSPFEDISRQEDIFHDLKSQKGKLVEKGGSLTDPRRLQLRIHFERLALVREKMLRYKGYVFQHQEKTKYKGKFNETMSITGIGSLLGTKGKKNVLGILLQIDSDNYSLEDDQARVSLVLEKGIETQGFINDGFVVVVTGTYSEGILTVDSFHLPEIETIAQSRKVYPQEDSWHFDTYQKIEKSLKSVLNLDILIQKMKESHGANSIEVKKLTSDVLHKQKTLGIYDLKSANRYFKIENREEYSLIVLSNFRMDNIDVLENFEKILQGLEGVIFPLIFILIGNFFSVSNISSEKDHQQIDLGVEQFLKVLNKHRYLKDHCYWMFVPGMNDIGLSCIPRMPFSRSFFQKLDDSIPYFINSSNPSKFTLLGKDFLVFQMDLLKELRRNQITGIDSKISQEDHMVKSILSQSHLSPRQRYKQPVNYGLDNAMRIYRLSEFVIIADNECKNFHKRIGSGSNTANIINPGCFVKNRKFYMIHPFKTDGKKVEECKI